MDAQDLGIDSKADARPRGGLGLATVRGLALFIGGFSLLNLLGEIRRAGFDANLWWIDLRPIPPVLARGLLLGGAALLIGWGLRPRMATWRRWATLAAAALLLAATIENAAHFWLLRARGAIGPGLPVPFSLLPGVSLALVLLMARRPAPAGIGGRRQAVAIGVTLAGCLVVFPLGQMYCFGKTDYRRPADAAVVFGARVYANGRLCAPLADRVRTGCELYRAGQVRCLIFSGGPGDGAIHETEAMRTFAVRLGVPEDAIVLDREGLNTEATARNTEAIFRERGIGRVLAVSHFYHLPRIKMTYQRQGREVLTVPARETYDIAGHMPHLIGREVVALWVYYLRPILP